MPVISDTLSLATGPAGARVYLKRFVEGPTAGSHPCVLAGTTPLSDLEIARGDYVIEFLIPAMNKWLDETLGPVRRQ